MQDDYLKSWINKNKLLILEKHKAPVKKQVDGSEQLWREWMSVDRKSDSIYLLLLASAHGLNRLLLSKNCSCRKGLHSQHRHCLSLLKGSALLLVNANWSYSSYSKVHFFWVWIDPSQRSIHIARKAVCSFSNVVRGHRFRIVEHKSWKDCPRVCGYSVWVVRR